MVKEKLAGVGVQLSLSILRATVHRMAVLLPEGDKLWDLCKHSVVLKVGENC